MLPRVDVATGNLPPGIHEATWPEFVARYGYNPARLALLAGMKSALDALRSASCRRVYIDGSFVSTKELPGDYDGCWEALGMDLTSLDPVLLTFTQLRLAQKVKYGGEFFPAEMSADRFGNRFVDFFQRDKQTGDAKGIVAFDLDGLP